MHLKDQHQVTLASQGDFPFVEEPIKAKPSKKKQTRRLQRKLSTKQLDTVPERKYSQEPIVVSMPVTLMTDNSPAKLNQNIYTETDESHRQN